jgi:D-lactate dehydrogenase
MTKIVIYGVSNEGQNAFSGIPPNHEVVIHEEPLSEENIDADAEIISIFVTSIVDEKIINKMPKLKLIACRSTGINNVDLATAMEQKITVVNVPSYGDHTVAEYTFALLLSLTRKITLANKQVIAGDIDHAKLHGIDLHGKTIGIVGAGQIGRNVIKLAKAFGMKVIVHDPFFKKEQAEKLHVENLSFKELSEQSDIITLHCPLTKDNKHMINRARISQMKDGVYIINTARGDLIETGALIEALVDGKVGGAALDVIEDEKLMDIDEEELLLKTGKQTRETLENLVENSILMRLPNAILTSHNAYNTKGAISRINDTTVNNIKHFLVGEVQNEVSI